MAQYNLIRSSLFNTTTTSGVGNKSLSTTQLQSLTDSNISNYDVSLLSGDVLCLDIDLCRRIKINNILLYADDLTKLSNINFYYKNFITDSFTACAKDALGYAYSAIVPDPSAPQYIRCTVSGVVIGLSELLVYNDDAVVAFGVDGTDTTEWLEDAPIGSLGTPYPVDIFNNTTSDRPATAYVSVDYTGTTTDKYIKISGQNEGDYVGVTDGVVYGYTPGDWGVGTYNNLTLNTNNNSLGLTAVGSALFMYKGKLDSLPLTSCSYRGVPFGLFQNPWCYAADRGKIYAIFYSGADDTNGNLKLYSYTLSNNTWTFVSLLYVGSLTINAAYISMTYRGNYIYFRYGNSAILYSYDLTGAQGNLTTLATSPVHGNIGTAMPCGFLCASTTSIFRYELYTINQWAMFDKYSIASNTWAQQSVSMYNDSSTLGSMIRYMVFDAERNVIYLYFPNTQLITWVQRYDIASNTWTQQFFNFASRVSSVNTRVSMAYYNNRLFFVGNSLGTKCYVYNIVTDIVTSFNLDIAFSASSDSYLLATSPQDSLTDFSLYFVGVANDLYSMYGYNVPFISAQDTITAITTASGTFTSNIFTLPSTQATGYLLVNSSSILGKNLVSKDPNFQEGSIEIRSSNTAPASIDEIYWLINMWPDGGSYVSRYIIPTDSFNNSWWRTSGDRGTQISSLGVCRRTGRMFVSYRWYISNSDSTRISIIDRAGTHLYINYQQYVDFYRGAHWDNNLGIWSMQADSEIRHYNNAVTTYSVITVSNVYDYCSELDGVGAWYTERSFNSLVKLNSTCQTQFAISLGSVYGVCGTEDNGCWVVDNGDITYGNTVKRYDYLGNLLQTIVTPKAFYRLTHDHYGGFYTRADATIGEVYHYDGDGNMTMVVGGLVTYDYIRGGRNGVVLHSPSMTKIAYVSLATKSIVWEKSRLTITTNTANTTTYTPDIFSWDVAAEKKYSAFYGSKLFPAAYETLWNNVLEWKEVPKNGYLLPNCTYHQLRVTLQNFDGTTTPELKNITIAPVVTIEDIPPQGSKPVYVRSNIPAGATASQFSTRLKVWWSLGE